MSTGIDEQADRLDRLVALVQLGGQAGGPGWIDRARPVRVDVAERDPAAELAAQRHAGRSQTIEQAAASEAVEQESVEGGSPREEVDEFTVGVR